MKPKIGILSGCIVLMSLLWPLGSHAQQSMNALFVGNSYTAVNNLPQMVQQVAASMGDQLTVQSSTPGGCTFQQHCTNQSMTMICNGGWDIVVLQEQSQYPSFPQSQVEAEVFPYAKRLVDSVYAHNPCAEPMFYMTWGRRDGDQQNAQYFPVLGTYEGMDSMLCLRYTYMAEANDASLCPVGRVWRYLRRFHGDIELYQSDGSHPSEAGSYAAACAFYVMFFHRDPAAITYEASLPPATAATIRSAVRSVVYENLDQWQRPRPQVTLESEVTDGNVAVFSAATEHADSLAWHFGDGTDTVTSALQTEMSHTYAATGIYTATLVASRHCMTDTVSVDISVAVDPPVGIGFGPESLPEDTEITLYPNPVADRLTVVLPAGVGEAAVAILGLDGRVLMSCPSPMPGVEAGDGVVKFEIALGDLPAGEYLLRLSHRTGTVVRKVVVRR